MPLTTRTHLPIFLRHTGTGRKAGRAVSYLCDEDYHERCTGLISPTGDAAYLCGCRDPGCTCNVRARRP